MMAWFSFVDLSMTRLTAGVLFDDIRGRIEYNGRNSASRTSLDGWRHIDLRFVPGYQRLMIYRARGAMARCHAWDR